MITIALESGVMWVDGKTTKIYKSSGQYQCHLIGITVQLALCTEDGLLFNNIIEDALCLGLLSTCG